MLFSTLLALSGALFFLVLRVQGIGGSFPPPLSAEQEQALLAQLQQHDEQARQQLIEHNLRLVAHIVKKYYADRSEEDDLISIGTIGLIKAVSTFQPEKSSRLATYASKCIQNELLMYFRQKRKSAGEVSLSESLDSDGEGSAPALLDTICCEDADLAAIDEHDRYNEMYRSIAEVLDPRERQILRLRYGLGLPRSLAQREVAMQLGISRSYVSRIEKKALLKLRSSLQQHDG